MLLLSLTATASRAQDILATRPGTESSGSVAVGVIRVPLPPGAWVPAAWEGRAAQNSGQPGPGFDQRIFMHLEGGRIAALLFVSANLVPSAVGWVANKDCRRSDTYWSDNRNGWTRNFECTLVNHYVMPRGERVSGLWRQALDQAAKAGGLPDQMIVFEYTRASQINNLFVQVFFNPELSGLSSQGRNWRDSAWQVDNLSPERRTYLGRVRRWGEAYRSVLRDTPM